jgi:hypothetical protein
VQLKKSGKLFCEETKTYFEKKSLALNAHLTTLNCIFGTSDKLKK